MASSSRCALAGLGLAAAVLLAACSGADDDSQAFAALAAGQHQPTGSIVFSGSIPGAWHPTTEWGSAVCGAGAVRIWIKGPAADDQGALQVKSDGSVWVDIEKYGDFFASGATFLAGKGFTLDTDVATVRGKHAHVKGTMNC